MSQQPIELSLLKIEFLSKMLLHYITEMASEPRYEMKIIRNNNKSLSWLHLHLDANWTLEVFWWLQILAFSTLVGFEASELRGFSKMRPTPLGEAYHIERAIAARQGISRYPCGCERCHGFKSYSTHRVEVYHRKYGRDRRLNEPLLVNSQINHQFLFFQHTVTYIKVLTTFYCDAP